MRTSAMIVVLALAASALATKSPFPDSKQCGKVICDTAEEFGANCTEYQVVRKAFQAGAAGAPSRPDAGAQGSLYGKCCDTFVCVQDPQNPCGGKECAADNLEEATANCNDLFPGDPIWTMLQPNYGAMYAVLKSPARDVEGRCCDEYVCRTDNEILCENLVAKTPCATAATCPLGHAAEVVRSKDPDNKRCCDEIRCVAQPDVLCRLANNDNTFLCPMPACDATYEDLQLQNTVALFAEDPYKGRCCPVYTCQNNLAAICEAEKRSTGFDYDNLCNDCEDLLIIEPENVNVGKCYPKYECVPKANAVCCGFDEDVCPEEPTNLGSCEYAAVKVESDFETGPCCDQWVVYTNNSCVCDAQQLSPDYACLWGNETQYEADVCGVDQVGVMVKEADPDKGICCNQYKCEITAQGQLQRMRNRSGPKIKATTQR